MNSLTVKYRGGVEQVWIGSPEIEAAQAMTARIKFDLASMIAGL